METIKVNMTPCEDIKTIHASQDDNEAREWGFELHNNGEKIDSSSISDQLVFKTYEGGTEQILPVNGSTPTTSPFKGDIKYPQGLLTDQEFTYRQSPTEEDGLAWIKNIKGNTLVWNQLVQNGNFADTSGTGFGVVQGTVSYANNTATVAPNASTDRPVFRVNQTISVANHRMLLMIETSEQIITFVAYTSKWTEIVATNDIIRVGNRNFIFFTPSSATSIHYLRFNSGLTSIAIKNVMCFDLTQMGLDISSPSDFTSLFPLSYYAYNQGTLLSFMGNGIKTVGKNLVFKTIPNSSINGSGVIISTSNFQMSVAQVLKGKEYVITTNDNSKKVLGFFYDEPVVGSASYNGERIDDSSSYTFTSPITGYVAFRSLGGYSTPMLEFGSTSTDYEPYTSSTLSLPISTYFTNGMKSAGSVYDELTETKAITRIGVVDMGTMTWVYEPSFTRFYSTTIKDLISKTGAYKDGLNCARYMPDNSPITSRNVDKTVAKYTNGNIYVIDTSYTDVTAFTNSLQGQYLYFELATYEETSFTTASLVTENAEIPLSNDDGVLIGKCTEQLSSESGFFDAKIKLADEDGECYSNKIQLHIERSPQ